MPIEGCAYLGHRPTIDMLSFSEVIKGAALAEKNMEDPRGPSRAASAMNIMARSPDKVSVVVWGIKTICGDKLRVYLSPLREEI